MPIYEYECQKCGHEFERDQRIIEDPIKTCPACKAQKAKRLISNTSFVLKGGGWYKDLYSSSSGKKESASDGDASASDAKSETKDEGKKDAKKESKGDSKADAKADSGSKSDSSKRKSKGGSKSAA